MMREEPLFRKCCYFLPLRLCLQTWAYIKLVGDILATSYLVLVIAILYSYDHGGFFQALTSLYLFVLGVVALIVDVGFLVTLVVGVFKKSFSILRVFYYYEFIAMTVEAIAIAMIGVNLLEVNNITEGVICLVFGIFCILLDVSIILTVKSEMIKLRNKEQYDFCKMPACQDYEGTGHFKIEEHSVTDDF